MSCLDWIIEDKGFFDEIINIRNIIVHNRGIINEKYLEKFPNSICEAGQKISFILDQFPKFYIKLTNSIASLDSELAKEFLLDLVDNIPPKSYFTKESFCYHEI